MSARDAATMLALLRLARTDVAKNSRRMISGSVCKVETEGVAAVRKLVLASDDDAIFVGACVALVLSLADAESQTQWGRQ